MVTKEETAIIVAPKDNLPQRLSPDSTICGSSAYREGNNSIVPEKPSEDGYNWRKYGQKNVKGNEYVRSYYKCSHPNCQVKKQVERSHDGRITDITYLGKHDHVKPNSDPQAPVSTLLSVKVQIADQPPVIAVEDTPSDVSAATTDNVEKMEVCELAIVEKTESTTPPPPTPSSLVRDDHGESLTLKKRKKGVDVTDSVTEKSNHESRVVVHTVSEVDVVNDGYRWRKYGQKMVKGNPNPRSYYRCSTTGCPVKKHVERASHDSRVVVTTYEGEHDHSMPPIRTILPQIPGTSLGGSESNGLTKSKSEESDPEKSDSVDPTATTKEENNSMVMIKTDDNTSRSTDQETRLAEKNNPITQTTKEQKAPSIKPVMGPEIVPTEAKSSVEPNKKPESVPTEAKSSEEPNKKPESVPTEAKTVTDPNKKPEIVPTEGKPSEEPNKKPEIVPIEAKPSEEPNKNPKIVPTGAKPLEVPNKKPEIVPTEAKQSEEPDKKSEVVPTEGKPSEEPDKKPEIEPTEAKQSSEPEKNPENISTEAKSNGKPK